ncbi:unnamed protein product [Caenorhabditis brenneri]
MDTFPLHRLPNRAIVWVLKRMKTFDQLAYSFCSTNTKKAIKTLNLKAVAMNFHVRELIEISIFLGNYIVINCSIDHEDYFPKLNIIAHKTIKFYVPRHREGWEWNFQNFEFNKWIHHFCEVLHHPKIDDLNFDHGEIEDAYIEPLQKAIEGLQIGRLSIYEEMTNDFAKKALEGFPNYEKLYLIEIPFGGNELNKLLIQNLKSVCFHYAEGIKIDQVLLTNSERIHLEQSTFTEKGLNRLLKLWIRGGNPRLKYFCSWGQLGRDPFDKDDILKGVKYEQVPLDSQEVYRDYIDEINYTTTKLAGGNRVWRFDGTTAVILVTGSIFPKFELIVE